MEQYLINISETHVGVPALKLEIEKGGWTDIDSTSVSHPDVIEAIRRKWLKLSKTKPEGEQSPGLPDRKIESNILGTSEYPGERSKVAAKSVSKKTAVKGNK